MIEFGKSLRDAREAKGLTIRQLAEITRMAPTTIQELETENFSRIAAPIYGRGFVKLYCSAVDLAPAEYVEEFMNLYNGNHESSIRERPLRGQSETEKTAPDTDIAAEPPVSEAVLPTPPKVSVPKPEQATDLFRQEPEPEPATDLFRQEPEPEQATDLFRQEPEHMPKPLHETAPMPEPEPKMSDAPQEPTLSRYAAPVRQAHHAHASFDPRIYFRLALLGLGALVILALVGFGIRAVYRATTNTAVAAEPVVETTPAPSPVTAAKPTAAAKPKTPADTKPQTPATAKPQTQPAKTARTPLKVPSLYID